MDSNVSLADIAAVTKDNDGLFGAGGGLWVLIILLFLMGGNGFWGNNQGSRCATIEDLNNQSNFTRLESQVAANGELTERKIDAVNSGLCTLGYQTAEKFGQVNTNIAESTASIKELLYKDKVEALQNQINQLQLQNAMANVVRYPSAFTYSTTCNPFCGTGCCGSTNI